MKDTYHYTTDVLIAGAGPAGISTSVFLAKEGIHHIIIDKAIFPRDKICGDALSGKSIGMLNRMTDDWEQRFVSNESKALVCNGIQFVADNGVALDIPFPVNQKKRISGFVSRRINFDTTLTGLLDSQLALFFQGTILKDIDYTNGGVVVSVQDSIGEKKIFAKMIVGAEGRSSNVAKKLAQHKLEPDHYSAGIRGYYKNVEGLHQKNFIELHFLKGMLPGYFWVFPLPDGRANVGLGMLSSAVSAEKADLKKIMLDTLQTHPLLKSRFAQAEPEGKIEGWGLPLGSKKRKLSGDRFLLTGDAGSLIDPFTGEGIGNALLSGLVAARAIKKAHFQNNYSAQVLQEYDEELYKKLWTELRLSRYLQILTGKPWLFNFVIKKASKSKELRQTISCMFENLDLRKKFANPLFYLRILFNR